MQRNEGHRMEETYGLPAAIISLPYQAHFHLQNNPASSCDLIRSSVPFVQMASVIFMPCCQEVCQWDLGPEKLNNSYQATLLGRDVLVLGFLDLRSGCPALTLEPSGEFRVCYPQRRLKELSRITARHDPWQYHRSPKKVQVPFPSLCREYFTGYTKGVQTTISRFSNGVWTCVFIAARPTNDNVPHHRGCCSSTVCDLLEGIFV